jgi:hypothetical protein
LAVCYQMSAETRLPEERGTIFSLAGLNWRQVDAHHLRLWVIFALGVVTAAQGHSREGSCGDLPKSMAQRPQRLRVSTAVPIRKPSVTDIPRPHPTSNTRWGRCTGAKPSRFPKVSWHS